MRTSSSDSSFGVSLIPFGWNESVAVLYNTFDQPGHYPGRVIRVDRGSSRIATPQGTTSAAMARGEPSPGSEPGPLATGDWVVLRPDQDQGEVVTAILPRRSAITRLDPSAPAANPGAQVLAANVDHVLVVHGLDRPPQPGRIERLLVLAWGSGAQPILVLTKTDLVDAGSMTDIIGDLAPIAPGVEIIAVSNKTAAGFEALNPLIGAGMTVALIGASGTGKSSLVNRLVGDDIQSTGDTRRGDGKGRHTTTSRDLIPLSSGAVLIDTPGLREVGLWTTREGLDTAFGDVTTLASSCRFRDCRHESEPGCAVTQAIVAGQLDERRLDSFRKLGLELVDLERQALLKQGRGSARSSRTPQPDVEEDW